MGAIKVGNAPVSWGVYESGVPTNPPWEAVLDAIAEAGYDGTELGPYGYLPKDPSVLGQALSRRKLALASSYVGLPLEDASKRTESVAHALAVGRLLATQGVEEIIVAGCESDVRASIAGRVPKDGSSGWTDAEWFEVTETLHAIARAARAELAMSLVVHHHVATGIETAEEIDRLLAATDPGLVNLLLDTGHAVYGGVDSLELIRKCGARIRYLHYKDVDEQQLERVRKDNVHKDDAWRQGIFCPLGRGIVDFPGITEAMRSVGYSGWVIVEQDVVPDDAGKLVPEPFGSARDSRAYLRQSADL